ncbi:MFS transporter [Salinarimonas ramus]|uniref:MFS transporter n=1 Tax=Salinarimonas ramus TaxID=690164 RepID=A0A917QHF3_9HYPH|nr:MFS transporter [Salinarimonas ramus]GGK49225.1 MFS transporter [Salinarimonas ramus]
MTTKSTFLVSTIMISGFLVVGQIYAVIPMLDAIRTEFDVTTARASLVATVFGLSFAAGVVVFGPIADMVDRARLLVGGLAALALASLAVAATDDFSSLVASRALQGFVSASFPATALALVADRIAREQQPPAFSMLGFAFLSSAPLSQLIVAELSLPISAVMTGAALLYLLCAVATYVAARLLPTPERSAAPAGGDADPAADATFPSLAAVILAPSAVLFGFVAFHAAAQLMSGRDPAIDPDQLRLLGFVPLLLCFAAPAISKRHGPAFTASAGIFLIAVAMIVAISGQMPLASVTVSAGVALAVPGLIATVSFWSGDAVRARAMATYTFLLFVGASVAPLFVAAVVEFDMRLAFLLPAALAATASSLLFVAHEIRRRRLAAADAPI